MTIKERIWRRVRPARNALRKAVQNPPVGAIDWGDFGRLQPINDNWGFERGTPVDRFYIGEFLGHHASDIKGRVLEVANNEYTVEFGGDRVQKSDILCPVEGNSRATIIADLTIPELIPENLFDCVICTQTLQFIFDVRTAISSLHRLLKPGGVLLLTVPGISQISREDMAATGDYWRFTTAALERLFGAEFPGDALSIESHGNVKSSVGLLHGVAAEEIAEEDLRVTDFPYQLILSVRAVRPR